MISNNVKNILQIFTLSIFLIIGCRYAYVLTTKTLIPSFYHHDHFIIDFEYFYKMGETAITDPIALYNDPRNEGTPVLLLNRQVFHPYPPPAAMIFKVFSLLPFALSHTIWSIAIYILIIIACILFYTCLKLENMTYNKLPIFPAILCLCAAPSFHDASFGNVNTLLLTLCILYTFLFIRNNFFSAGIVLSIAFWIKLYPILLLVTFLFAKNKMKLFSGFVIGVISFLLLTVTFIPLDVFKEFFIDIAPAYTQQTITHIFNQSFTATLSRVLSPPDACFSYVYIKTPDIVRSVNYLLCAIVISSVLTIKFSQKQIPVSVITSLMCALIPLVTPIGWGYTFVLTYPALLTLFYNIPQNRISTLLLYIACWFPFATPSFHRIYQYGLPWFLDLLYYSRYTLSSIVVIVWLEFLIFTKQWQKLIS